MARALLLTTIYIVVLSCCNSERRPFLHYSNHLYKANPHHWNHDQEELGRRVDAVAGGHQAAALKPRPPPLLQPLEGAPWRRWTKEALHTNTNKESRNIRKRLLEQKLKPNHPSRVIVHNNKKHKLEATLHGMPRVKRDLTETKDDFAERPGPVRAKRQVLVNPVLQPEVVMQPHIQAPLHQSQETQYQEKVDQKRDKRHIFYLINKPAAVYTGPRATVNPFIREANTDDYEIVRPEADYQGRGLGPSSDVDSYQLRETKNVLSDITKSFLNFENWLKSGNQNNHIYRQVGIKTRDKRSPRMSKLKKKQKLEKKKRKKKKQQNLTPRQIKHYRRIREHKEERRKILHKKLKEKRRLRHKKLGTGPYNKTIIDYYGIYFDPPSSQINESLYDSIYDTGEIDSDKAYDEQMKNYSETIEEDYTYEEDDDDEINDDSEEGSQNENGDADGKGDDEKRRKDSPNTSEVNTKAGSLNYNELHTVSKHSNSNNKVLHRKEGINLEHKTKLELRHLGFKKIERNKLTSLQEKPNYIKRNNNDKQQTFPLLGKMPKTEQNLINIIFDRTVSNNKQNKNTLNRVETFSENELLTPKYVQFITEKHTIPNFLQDQNKRSFFLL